MIPSDRYHLQYCVNRLVYFFQGSTVQREASEKEKTKEFPTFKDNDFVKDNAKIYMGKDAREEFLAILKRDVEVGDLPSVFMHVVHFICSRIHHNVL